MTKEKNTGIITSLPVSEDIKTASGLPASKKYIKRFAEPLHFGADGKFRILHLTDIHEVDPEMDDDEDKSRIAWNIRCIDSGDYIRGGRLIVIDENKPFEYTSELIFPE